MGLINWKRRFSHNYRVIELNIFYIYKTLPIISELLGSTSIIFKPGNNNNTCEFLWGELRDEFKELFQGETSVVVNTRLHASRILLCCSWCPQNKHLTRTWHPLGFKPAHMLLSRENGQKETRNYNFFDFSQDLKKDCHLKLSCERFRTLGSSSGYTQYKKLK